jgi:hypothetical protein
MFLHQIFLCVLLAGTILQADELPNYASMIPSGTVKPFVEGDRIAFLGDSITSGGKYHKFYDVASKAASGCFVRWTAVSQKDS